MLTTYLIIGIVSYLLGSIPFGYILVKLFLKQDIRQTGSGNIGATNVARSGAKGLAIATLLLDAGKGAAAVLVAALIYGQMESAGYLTPLHDYSAWIQQFKPLVAFGAFMAIIGHCFPVWLKFRGGKGVATAIGAFAIVAPQAALLSVAIFMLAVLVTRYVSVGSVLSAIAFPFAAALTLHHVIPIQIFAVTSAASALIVIKHRDNIRRLLAGTEHKFGAPKAPADPVQAEKNA